jgi:hypothetical protein
LARQRVYARLRALECLLFRLDLEALCQDKDVHFRIQSIKLGFWPQKICKACIETGSQIEIIALQSLVEMVKDIPLTLQGHVDG